MPDVLAHGERKPELPRPRRTEGGLPVMQTSKEAMISQVSGVPEGPAARAQPGDAQALDATRRTTAHAPAARPAGRDPATRSSAARHDCQQAERRCQTRTTA